TEAAPDRVGQPPPVGGPLGHGVVRIGGRVQVHRGRVAAESEDARAGAGRARRRPGGGLHRRPVEAPRPLLPCHQQAPRPGGRARLNATVVPRITATPASDHSTGILYTSINSIFAPMKTSTT